MRKIDKLLKENKQRMERDVKSWKSKHIVVNGEFVRKKKRRGKIPTKKRIPKQYSVYIKSEWWTKRKNKFYKENEKRCMACLGTKYIDLHHLFYGNYGNETDEQLVALCRLCHEEYHQTYGVAKDMIHTTNIFIIEKREEIDFNSIIS